MTERGQEIAHKIKIALGAIVPPVALLIGIYLTWNKYVFASDMILLVTFYIMTGLGIGVGYHRMLTHQGFKAPEWVRGLFMILGCMALEGRPISWTATHVKHHAHSDEEGDPHSPLDGFWHSHYIWFFDAKRFADAKEYAPHLLRDKTALFVDRYALLWELSGFVIPFVLGGWTGFLWGGLIRLGLTIHVTASVNSVCHTFGRREFETTDESRNEWIVGVLALGEGWHNNHHAFPTNAFHGMRWWQFDLNGIVIRFMEMLGLAWDVQRVSPDAVIAHKTHAEKSRASAAAMRAQVLDAAQAADRDLQSLFGDAIALSISDPEAARVRDAQRRAIRRIREIRTYVDKASHLKKQKLTAYMNELQQLKDAVRATRRSYALARA